MNSHNGTKTRSINMSVGKSILSHKFFITSLFIVLAENFSNFRKKERIFFFFFLEFLFNYQINLQKHALMQFEIKFEMS